MYTIELKTTEQSKNPNTKTTYITDSIEVEVITEEEYDLITNEETVKWFRRLGGSGSVQRSYTYAGYVVTKLTSISPDRQNKKIREFKFKITK